LQSRAAFWTLRHTQFPGISMKLPFTASLIAIALASTPALSRDGGAPLTPEIINGETSLSGPSVRGAAISPDGSLVTLLRGRAENSRQLDLWAYDAKTGEARVLVSSTELVKEPAEMSEEEKNRRERQRIYDNGITAYQWDRQGRRIAFPLGGDVFLYDLTAKAATRVTQSGGYETDVKFSPKGGFVAYVRDDELYAYDIATNKERKVTSGAGGTIRNSVAEFVAQEELDRDTGYWISPDDGMIAFAQVDESPIPLMSRLDINADGATSVEQRYPFAGKANAIVKLFVVPTKGGKPRAVDLGAEKDIYLARVHWSADSSALYVERLSRDQKRLDLLKVDPKTGASRLILTEQSPTWINLSQDFTALEDGGFLWTSEKSGFRQIYRHDGDGKEVAAVTSAPGLVGGIDCVDEANDVVYYNGWEATPLARHLYAASLNGGGEKALTEGDDQNGASYSGNCTTSIRSHASARQPRQISVHDASGARKFWLEENRLDANHPYSKYLSSHIDWTYGQLDAADGTKLDYSLLKPALKKGEKAPAIVLVYGGPHAQTVAYGFGDFFAQMLADNGYVVFRIDNRGAWNRGKAFEETLYRAMGTVEVEDQAVGAKFLKSLPYVDGSKIGVYGWSYGGYMTLRMLTATPDLYAAGVSGAPVTDWALYDTAYTERYMGAPDAEKAAYEAGSVFKDLADLKAKLLVIHGMADDNVVFQNSVALMAALQKQGSSFELMTYPGEKHGFRSTANKIHRDRLILDFFDRTLKGSAEKKTKTAS
jgi:dipeptidyl-peptidase-4